jgi:catechol 2,3-dioxygenase-like lactoylglutathione lyase family enzyme
VAQIPFRVLAADHTGLTVSDLDRSLAFWCDGLGFELSHRVHQSGALAEKITGIAGAEISIAVVKAPGHKIELLQYHAPADRAGSGRIRSCDVGAAHVALLVDDLEAVLQAMARHDWQLQGEPQTLTTGPNTGKRVVYVRDPDGTTIELMQPRGD